MRVLFWSPVFWPKIGGVEVHAAKLLPALKARGHEFIVVTTQSHLDLREEDRYQGIPVHRFPFWEPANYIEIDALMRVRQRVAALKHTFAPDLVHINAVDASVLFHLLTHDVNRAPVLVTLHGEWPAKQDGLAKRALNAADWIAGCSRAILDKGRQLAPDIIPRSCVIYNGLDAPSLVPEPLPFDPPRLLCLGRLSPEKGFDLALSGSPSSCSDFRRPAW